MAGEQGPTMKAVMFRAFGPPSVLEVVLAHPKPQRKKGEVLVRVCCASVNPIDWKTRKGEVPRLLVKLPKILGGDVAGVVEEADEGGRFKKGDRVFGCTGQQEFWKPYGTYAEYVSAPEHTLAAVPAKLSMEQAAALPLAGMTAWQALAPGMPLEGKRVLVHAGAGGVGSLCIQIAKAQGAHVTTTCSGRNVGFVKSELGADVAVDYTTARFEDEAERSGKFDLVVDTIGGDYEQRSLPLVAEGGHFAEILNSGFVHKYGMARGSLAFLYNAAKGSLMGALGAGPSYSLLVMKSTASQGLDQMVALVNEGKLKAVIDRALPLEQAAAAHEHVEEGHARGKVVLQVAEE